MSRFSAANWEIWSQRTKNNEKSILSDSFMESLVKIFTILFNFSPVRSKSIQNKLFSQLILSLNPIFYCFLKNMNVYILQSFELNAIPAHAGFAEFFPIRFG